MPKALVQQCNQLVETWTDQLVDMLLADFTPEEVCEFLKICKKPKNVELVRPTTPDVDSEPYEILTNEIDIPETNYLLYVDVSDEWDLIHFYIAFFTIFKNFLT